MPLLLLVCCAVNKLLQLAARSVQYFIMLPVRLWINGPCAQHGQGGMGVAAARAAPAVTQFCATELSVFVLLNFVTSMYALGAFVTKVRVLWRTDCDAVMHGAVCMAREYTADNDAVHGLKAPLCCGVSSSNR